MAGVKFNIPEGYDEFEDASINGAVDEETQFITYCKFYTGGLEDMIIIAVAYPRGDDFKFTLNDVLNDAVKDFMNRNNVLNESYTRKTINGHEGGFIQQEGNSTFTYVEESKMIMIMSNNESLISHVIV